MIDHDQLFKTLIKTFFRDFMELTIPKLTAQLHPEKARFLEQEHFTRPARGRRLALDLIAETPARRGPPWLVHVEIERVYRRTVPRRMGRYYMQLRLDHRRKVLPIVLYLRGGPRGLRWDRITDEIGGHEIASFSYLAFGLSRSDADAYLARPEPLAWALAALMRNTPLDRAEHKLSCLRAIARAELDDLRRFLLLEVVETYLVLEGDDAKRYDERVAQERNQEVRAMEMTWSQKLEARGLERGRVEGLERGRVEGLERGRVEGLERGRVEGARRTLSRLLERRFGPLTDSLEQRLVAISELEALETLVDRALEARSLRELGLDDE